MAKANRGSVKTKRATAIPARSTPVKPEPVPSSNIYSQVPTTVHQVLPDAPVINQPPSGISIGASSRPVNVETPPDQPIQEHDFTFRIEPGVGSTFNCIAVRDDGEEQSYRCETEDEAKKMAADFQFKLDKRKSILAQEKAEKEAAIKPIETPGGQIIPLIPDTPPTNEPLAKIPESVPGAELKKDTTPVHPRFEGELVYQTRRHDLPDLHVLPELAPLVAKFMSEKGNTGIDAFNVSENGLTIVTWPGGKMACFQLQNGKPYMRRI